MIKNPLVNLSLSKLNMYLTSYTFFTISIYYILLDIYYHKVLNLQVFQILLIIEILYSLHIHKNKFALIN
jgi:hypothetical protein